MRDALTMDECLLVLGFDIYSDATFIGGLLFA